MVPEWRRNGTFWERRDGRERSVADGYPEGKRQGWIGVCKRWRGHTDRRAAVHDGDGGGGGGVVERAESPSSVVERETRQKHGR